LERKLATILAADEVSYSRSWAMKRLEHSHTSKLTEKSSSSPPFLSTAVRTGRSVTMAPLTELPAQQAWQADDELTKPLRQ